MKKKSTFFKNIAILLIVLHSSVSFSQTWNLVDNTLFGGYFGLEINGLLPFKNNFYAATGYNNASGAFIFSSASGDTNTWYQQFSFSTLMNGNQMGVSTISSTNAGGGYLYAGTRNYTDGPIVCKSYDGYNWDSLPMIPYSNFLSDYYEISSIAAFNPSGPEDDTIFVAVQNGMDGAEIWKNYYLGGPWTQVYDFAYGTTGRINGLTKFNNKLYACTNVASIYESADGNNWTMNAAAGTGFGDTANTSFTKMVVFQNRLYVATMNYLSGPQIWSTADGLTWAPMMTNDFGNSMSMAQITDLIVGNNKLWVSSYSPLSGGSFAPGGGETRGGMQFTYVYSSTNGSTYTNLNNDGFMSNNRSGRLGYFNNFIYQGSDNVGWGPGELWRMCQAPTPSISPANSTACLFAPVYFADTLSTAVNYDWYVDDTLATSGPNFSFYPTYLGTHTIKLIERNGTCTDSTTTLVTVHPNPVSFATSTQNVCVGDSVLMVDTVSGGTAPYTVVWDDEGSNFITGDSLIFQAQFNTMWYVNVTDANGCSASSTSGYNVSPRTDVFGTVTYSGGPVMYGTVVAYKYVPYLISFDTVAVDTLDALGSYYFPSLNHNDYIFKVFADTLIYPTLIPTYYGNTFLWDSATVFTHDCAVNDTLDIVMSEEAVIGGPGYLRGKIIEGPGFGRAEGDPIPGIDVKLGHNPGGQLMFNTTTGTDGYYYFSGVPLITATETYTVYVDIPGLARDSSYSFTLNPGTSTYLYLDYIVDTNSIYIDPNAGVGINNPGSILNNSFSVYPNPTKGNATISYFINSNANVSLGIYNVLGVKVADIVNENQTSGNYKYTISSKDYQLISGIYFITLITDGKTSIHRLVITE